MVNICPSVRSESKNCSARSMFQMLMSANRHYVPLWITAADGREMQERVWNSISKRLRVIDPGCI